MSKKFNNQGDKICNHNFDGGLCKKCLAPETPDDQQGAKRAFYAAEALEGRYTDTFGRKIATEQAIIDAHRSNKRQ